MKLSNLRNYTRRGETAIDWKFTATVDVTTGFLWWKKTVTRDVARKFAGFWFFMDNGEHTPGFQMDKLVKPINFMNGW